MNKKGFTVVELIVSFTLAMVISVFLFQIVINLKNLYTNSTIKTELINIQSLVSREMNENFKKGIISVDECGDRCFEFFYTDDTSDKLIISDDSIEFGNYKSKLPKNSYIRNESINIASSTTLLNSSNDSLLIINVPIYNDNFKDEIYNIKIVYPFNSNENDLSFGIEFTMDPVVFDYTGGEQVFTVPHSGYYKLETWGAQGGGTNGGYGGYSQGTIYLKKDEIIYINVGGTTSNGTGGYNGGGSISGNSFGGGGATHISKSSGLLSSLSNKKEDIIIVAGAGGGRGNGYAGGSGGGAIGVNGTGNDYGRGGTQTSGGGVSSSNGASAGTFGKGGNASWQSEPIGGGGGGYYGGGSGGGTDNNGGGGGGSGYIKNSNLFNKIMYCYNCSASTESTTLTYSTTNVSDQPISEYAKKGNGYAKISYVGESVSSYSFFYTGSEQTFTVPNNGYYKLEAWGAQGGSHNGGIGGLGAYTEGVIYLKQGEELYVNVGGAGSNSSNNAGGYNGGGYSKTTLVSGNGATGGGATDFRFKDNNLYGRIMVAAGGSGSEGYNGKPGGTLNGESYGGSVATQVSGGTGNYGNGAFGTGAIGTNCSGAGGGYFGGGTNSFVLNYDVYAGTENSTINFTGIKTIRYGKTVFKYKVANKSVLCSNSIFGDPQGSVVKECRYSSDEIYVSGSGSSFISGHLGCIAIEENGNTTPRLDSNNEQCTTDSALSDIKCSHHYTNKIFTKTNMISGVKEGNGYAKITYIGESLE